MNSTIPMEKFFEMYGRVSIERDMQAQRIQALEEQLTQKIDKIEKTGVDKNSYKK